MAEESDLMTDTSNFIWNENAAVYSPSSFFDLETSNFEDLPLSSPSLDQNIPSSPHLTGSESSPDIFAQEYYIPNELEVSVFFNDPNFGSYVANEEPMAIAPQIVQETIKEEKKENETKKERKRGKKRQRKEDESTDISQVQLSREQLLCFSSEDLDQVVQNVQRERPLTYFEEKEVKRQKR
jgi:hypothetical protein